MDRELAQALAEARAAWPAIPLAEGPFATYVAERATKEGCAPSALRAADLYLACACAQGDSAAIRAFETTYGSEIDAAHRRFAHLPATAADVRQLVLEKLFVGARDVTPKILDYSGRGDVRTWLRVTVVRMLINMASREAKELPAAEEFFLALPDPTDVDAARLREVYRAELRQAFGVAVERLTTREKSLLRYGFVEELSIDQMGTIYGVHRATAARWLAEARESLAKHVRAALVERLNVGKDELESILRVVMSQVDMTLSGYLRAES